MARDGIGARVEAALDHAEITQEVIAERIGTDQGTISRIIHGKQTGARAGHLRKIADELRVSYDWLRHGENPPAWYRPHVHETGREYRIDTVTGHTEMDRATMLSLVGTVTAGDGLMSFEESPRAFIWKRSWAVMRVEGDSAYPVVYPNQMVIIDTDRPVHHNNLVVVEVDNEEEHRRDPEMPRVKAYLKRYCLATAAPDGYVLASVNSGRDSPYIPKSSILAMVPVVGVIFEE